MPHNRLRNKRISSLFVLRFVCVFIIVAIHYPMAYTDWLQPVMRTAVPLFLMTSGYFLYSENRTSTRKRIRRSLSKMIWIILYANFTFGCLKAIAHATGASDALPSLGTLSDWLKLIFLGNTIVEYFWYLTAYTEALLIFLLFFRCRLERILMYLTPLLLIPALLLGKYSFLLDYHYSPSLYIGRNFLTIALPCICIGYMLHRYERPLLARFGPRLRNYILVILAVAMIEGFLLQGSLQRMGDLFISSMPLAIAIFLLCLSHKNFGTGSPIDRMGEKHALNIYIFQALIAGVVISFGQKLLGTDISLYATPLIFLGSLLFSEIIIQTHRALAR